MNALKVKLCKNYAKNSRDESVIDDENENSDHVYNSILQKPFKREYILRTSASRPAPYSRSSPQRMYCLLSNTEFRLSGAFSEDTIFF